MDVCPGEIPARAARPLRHCSLHHAPMHTTATQYVHKLLYTVFIIYKLLAICHGCDSVRIVFQFVEQTLTTSLSG